MLASLRSKVAGETGEMEEPVTGDVQIFLSSKEGSVSMRSVGVCLYLCVVELFSWIFFRALLFMFCLWKLGNFRRNTCQNW